MEGYIIVPIKDLPEELQQRAFSPQEIISPREMIAMYTSSVMEINKGDHSQKSLNIKLYNCLADYAQAELDAITKRNLK